MLIRIRVYSGPTFFQSRDHPASGDDGQTVTFSKLKSASPGATFAGGLVAQRLKRLPAMWETQVWSLRWEDPLEKEMATHSSILAWRIPWREEPGRLLSKGSQRVRHN